MRAERMIHFFPPHLEKIRAKVPAMAQQTDVMCGNLEDAIPADAKEADFRSLKFFDVDYRLDTLKS